MESLAGILFHTECDAARIFFSRSRKKRVYSAFSVNSQLSQARA